MKEIESGGWFLAAMKMVIMVVLRRWWVDVVVWRRWWVDVGGLITTGPGRKGETGEPRLSS